MRTDGACEEADSTKVEDVGLDSCLLSQGHSWHPVVLGDSQL